MPDSTSMRRAASAALVALVLLTCAACGSAKATPTVAKQNFTPDLVLDITDCHTAATGTTDLCPPKLDIAARGGAPDTQAHTAKAGSVLLIRNQSLQDRRLVGTVKEDQVFDTGVMHPGDTTLVKLDTSGKVTITETGSNASTTLTVKPAANATS